MENQKNELSSKPHETILLINQIKQGIKLRELSTREPLRLAMLYAYSLVGLNESNYPKETEKAVLEDFIIGTYGGLVVDEIRTAFKMAVAHKFTDLDVNCYQKFSPEYFGRVMASYYIWRMAQLQKPQEITYIEPKFNMADYFEKCLFEPYDKLKNGADYPYSDLDGWMFFDALYKIGIRFIPDDETREAFMAEARRLTPKKERRKVYEKLESDEDHEKRIKKKAKALAFKNWIEQQIFEETDLRSLITPKLKQP